MNKMTPKELADLAEVAFLADPEMLASTMLSVGASRNSTPRVTSATRSSPTSLDT